MKGRFKEENLRILRGAAKLLRNTTWKCGRLEKLIIRQLQRSGGTSKVQVIIRKLNLDKPKARHEFIQALRRLKERYIIEVEKNGEDNENLLD